MKKLNITRKQFGESKYFTRKYGKITQVSESGNLYKTSKGRIIKFTEAKAGKYDGISNSWDKIKEVVESTSASIEEAAKKMESISRITYDSLQKRVDSKKAVSTAKKIEKETDFIDKELKDIAEKIDGDSPLFFAVAEHGHKLGVVIDKVKKVVSQDDVRDATLATLTNPEIHAENEELNELSNSIIKLLDIYSKKLVENGIINPEGKELTTLKAGGIYDQDDDGKMHKVAEGKLGDMAKGAWNSIKGGASKILDWVKGKFLPHYETKEEQFERKVRVFDKFLDDLEAQLTRIYDANLATMER